MFHFEKILLATALLLGAAFPTGAATEPMPYDSIANIHPDSGVDQRRRDSLTLKVKRIRLNQAGYRTQDVKEGMAKFYYVGSALAFDVLDTATKTIVGNGAFTSKGFNSGTSFSVKGSRWAGTVAGGDSLYALSTTGLGTTIASTGVMEGTLPTTLREGGVYRIIVGSDTTYPFIVSSNVYGMVRDGVLKFFGINRSGSGPSWFHKPSHMKDGALATPSAPGAYEGGWYDCGDHLKEPQTMGYALAMLASVAATMPERDADNYGISHANTIQTDGRPDMLFEAYYGAKFFLNSWTRHGRSVGPKGGTDTGMVTGVGDFGKDHGWWGRPENQDAMTETGRGGWKERILRSELGANTLGDVAAGLAILSRRWRPYDAKWADTALMAAKDMYNYAKAHRVVVSSPAYNGAGPDKVNGNLALAATALLWATKDKAYLSDIAYDKTIGTHGEAFIARASWEGGWMVMSNPNLRKGGANTDWANRHATALYTFYKLILADKDSALAFGVRDEAERQNLIAHTMAGVIDNLAGIGGTNGIVIDLPTIDPNHGGGLAIRASSDWFVMFTQQEWVWNRYQVANALELYYYYDITRDLEAGLGGTSFTGLTWNRDKVRQLMVRQMDYMLGLNPWDVSMIMGLGDKNLNHPHHRAANPEGRNTPGTPYQYHVPVGALYGAWNPTTATNNNVRDYWNNYHNTEVCLDGAATSVAIAAGLAADVPLNIPPKAVVKVVYVSDTSAQIEINLDKYGKFQLDYGLAVGNYTKVVTADSTGVIFKFTIGGLKPATQYFFDVVATDVMGNSATYTRWENPLPDGTPFSWTTKATGVGPADIQNVKVCNVTADSAEIMWFTPDGEHQSSICYGTSPATATTCLDNIDESGHPTKFHYVKIGGLKEQTTYYFKVGSDGVWDDNGGAYYKFRTPVKMANFSLYAVQYQWSGMPALGINVVNNESRDYDSLSVRVYVRSQDTLKDATGKPLTHILSTSTGLVNVPLLFEQAIAARYDICQAYDGAGFNKPCDDPVWGLNWSWSTLNRGVQMLRPMKMPETYDSVTKTTVFYFDLPLGPTMMKQGSRIRFDVMFAARSEYSKTLTAAQLDLINWVKVFVPTVPVYHVNDTGWFDALDQPLAAHPMGKNTTDWSWMPHSVANGDPVDFVGIPAVANQTAANALIDNLSDEMPLNPYMTVYRKGEFVYGFSPSHVEQSTKKTYWGAEVKFAKPFDVPYGTTITLDTTTSLIYVKGTANIYDKLTPAAKGVITDIWVNGTRLTAAELSKAATQDPATKLWNLNIPVRMAIGGQNVDITIFGGSGTCSDTATTCDNGCAFDNGYWFVQFTKGKSTKSSIAILDPTFNVVSGELVGDSSLIVVEVRDGDNNKNGKAPDALKVLLRSGKDSLLVTLTETGDSTGVFRTGAISISSTAGWTAASISPAGGDTLVAIYRDAFDTEDSAIAKLRVKSLWPLPVRGGIFRSCGGAYEARVLFDRAFPAGVLGPDTVILRTAAGDSLQIAVVGSTTTFDAATKTLTIPLATASENGSRTGRAVLSIPDGKGSYKTMTQTLSDSVGPWIDSAKIVENLEGRAVDTIALWVSEPMIAPSKTWFMNVLRSAVPLPTTSVVVDSAWLSDPAAGQWTVVLRTGTIAAGDKIILDPAKVRDLKGNPAEVCDALYRDLKLWVRQAPISRAWISDANGDGAPDQVNIVYKRVLRTGETPDAITVRFGVGDSMRVVPVTPTAGDSIVRVALPVPYSRATTVGSAVTGAGSVVLVKSGDSLRTVLADSVSPNLLAANLVYGGAAVDTLYVTFSEPLDTVAGTAFMQILRTTGQDLAAKGSPIAVSQWVWKFVVDTGSVVPGDSVRPKAGGRFVDGSGRTATLLHPWVEVQGVDRAPSDAWYSDKDGDGKVDQVVMRWARSPRKRPGFLLLWPSTAGGFDTAVVAGDSWTLQADGVTAIFPITTFDAGVTSSPTTDLGRQVLGGGIVAFPIRDSVGPVLVSARIRYGATDTLSLVFSEKVSVATLRTGLEEKGANPLELAYVGLATTLDGLTWTVPVAAGSLFPGDSIRPAAVGGYVDVVGNRPSTLHRWVPVMGVERPPQKAWYSDADGDGAVDRIHLVWLRGPRTLPQLVLLWPSLAGGMDTVVVAAGSWSLQPDGISAVLSIGPFDKGVTSAPTTDLGRQISDGTWTPFAIQDSVPPVLLTARISYGLDLNMADTLHLVFSERVALDPQTTGLNIKGAPERAVPYVSQGMSEDGISWAVGVAPATMFVGDSVRPSALLGYVDASSNRPSSLHSWVNVTGAERPPQTAWYTDADGDGAVDHVTLRWAFGPRTKPALTFLWPNGAGGMDSIVVAEDTWTLDADGKTLSLPIGPFKVGVTSSPTTNLGRQSSAGTITAFAIQDSVAAVMSSARVAYASADGEFDTLQLVWSEPIQWTGADPLVYVQSKGVVSVVRGMSTTLRTDRTGGTILLDPMDSALTVFRKGDVVRLAPASAGTLTDDHGNAVEDPTRWVPVVLGRRPPRFNIVFDPNKLKYKGWVVDQGPALQIWVKSATDREWTDFETGAGISAEGAVQGLGPTIALNQPLRGKAILYDNQGTFVAKIDLDLLGEAFYSDRVPKDASDQYEVRIQWNGKSASGAPAASGVYMMRLVLWQNIAAEDETPEYRVVNKIFTLGWEVPTK